jgi:hypothetical protein
MIENNADEGMFVGVLLGAGFFNLTDRTEPARSGTGLPVRFGGNRPETGRIQIRIQTTQYNRVRPVYRLV